MLILREEKGSKLTIQEMDGNLTYLESLYTGSTSGTSGVNGNSGTSGTSGTGEAGTSGTSGIGSPGTSGTSGSSGLLPIIGDSGQLLYRDDTETYNYNTSTGLTYDGSTLTTNNLAISGSLSFTGVTGITYNGVIDLWSSVPLTSDSVGTAGSLAYDSTNLYVCVATNSWIKITGVTF